ncbi:MAG: OmpA family protein [Gammaproteobacteria bacterium]|jgi:outer membrane protein OmpA-like peptidoglycan-associated protein
MHRLAIVAVSIVGCSIPAVVTAQAIQQRAAIASSDVLSQISMFNYREGPKSDLLFRGTPIAARAEGEAEVEYQDGNASISAEVEDLPDPRTLGPYTTYVLWALTPDGRAANLGVIVEPGDDDGELETSYATPQFALIVTAEPHFAVSVPSTMIALFNVGDRVRGTESRVTTLTEREDYSWLATIAIDEANTFEIVQARYAVAIAEAADAAQYAPRDFTTANERLASAQTAMAGRRSEQRAVPGLAREAVIAAADAQRASIVAAARAAVEAERAAAAAEATRIANEAAAERAAQAAAEAELARAAAAEEAARRAEAAANQAARDDLRNRLNAALPTRESDRGLVSEIGGVQFATGAATINPGARESLARFAGIVAAFPRLQFSIEGHTDNVGSAETNNELSYRRASAVRDYLIGQGIDPSRIDVMGFGFTRPAASNDTVEGRARNRRVEIILSGGLLDL